MTRACLFGVVSCAILAPCAAAQIVPVEQERSVLAAVSVSSGADDADFDNALNFGPFIRTVTATVSGAGGASADAIAAQSTAFTSNLVGGSLSARSEAHTGTTFVTGDSDGTSALLYIFSLAVATPVEFSASGSLAFLGRDPNGEPSDLYGIARVRLIDANSSQVISGFELNEGAATDSAFFSGTLPAGQYVILARAQTHAFSAELLGPPARSGWGESNVAFSLTVVPAPGAAALLGLGGLVAIRRRR